jgi:hypothetical protein
MDSMKDLKVPQELRDKWRKESRQSHGASYISFSDYLIAQAVQWAWDQREPEIQAAADAELEAICEWLKTGPYGASIACGAEDFISDLRAARRPEPPSLKQRALKAHSRVWCGFSLPGDGDIILHALEALPDE